MVRRIHPPERHQVDAHAAKPCLLEHLEILPFETRRVRRTPDWVVPENIHSATQLLVLLEHVCPRDLAIQYHAANHRPHRHCNSKSHLGTLTIQKRGLKGKIREISSMYFYCARH